jgi:hypothetical protein
MTYQSESPPYNEKWPQGPWAEPLCGFVGKPAYSEAVDSRVRAMGRLRALLFASLILASCSKAPPPSGRWEGGYDSGDTFVAARLEIENDGQVRVSAPDVTDAGVSSYEDRTAMRQNMATRLAGAWGEVAPRPMDFDGSTFRRPGGIAPQVEWNDKTKAMTLYVYLGTAPVIKMPLHKVDDFSDDPWAH